MKNNVIILVIDMLSKWYIDRMKTSDSFWKEIEKNSYCADNMYAMAPFTDGAVRSLLGSEQTLEGGSYFTRYKFKKPMMLDLFRDNGYQLYRSNWLVGDNYRIGRDNIDNMPRFEAHGFQWTYDQIKYYCLKKKKSDYSKVACLLEQYFEVFMEIDYVRGESEKYESDKLKYIEDIYENLENSSFFKNNDQATWDWCQNTMTYINRDIIENKPLVEEIVLSNKIKYKNIEYMQEMHADASKIEQELNETVNPGLIRNNDALPLMRLKRYERLKKDMDDFLQWYDTRDTSQPYMAYIHNQDFHYPEAILDSLYGEEHYVSELQERIRQIDEIKCCGMSVVSQLSLLKIEENLRDFWKELQNRGVFDNSYVILTADHGVANFMDLLPKSERWNFTDKNFHVPFYMLGPGITPYQDNKCKMMVNLLPTLIQRCDLDTKNYQYPAETIEDADYNYVCTAWINGIPDCEYRAIKMGIRNEKYSITIVGYVTQFYAGTTISALYDLEKDPDEVHNLYKEVIEDVVLDELLENLKVEWFTMVSQILTDSDGVFGLHKKYSFLQEKKQQYAEMNDRLEKISWDDLVNKVDGREVIMYGTGKELTEFVSYPKFVFNIKEVWDNDESLQGTYKLGRPVARPNAKSAEGAFVIVSGRDEFAMVEHLEQMNINDYVLSYTVV